MTKQRAAESKFAISVELVDLGKQSVRIGSAQSEDEAHGKVGDIVAGLRIGGRVVDVDDSAREFVAADVFSVFAYSITADGPNETVVETRIRPNGRAKQEKRAA